MRLILLFLLLPFVGMAQNDTTKYYKSLDYGWNYQRLKARAAMVLPSDTIANKLGIVTIDTFLFVGNGVRWAKVGGAGGGGTADSTIFYTKYRSDTSRSNIYSAIGNKLNTLHAFNFD
jgi:F0F1-type ATP synthase alpha subunit